ncbi:MAG: sugar kinase [Bergeyella sp.]|nr:sugar kinase [Bergeyella sp.]
MKLLAVGSMAYDAIETPFGKTDKILGGAASYIGLAASVMKVDVSLVTVVGEDFHREYLEMFERKNINIEGVEIVKGGKSFFWSGKYSLDLNTRDTLITEVNVLADFDPKIPPHGSESEVLLLGNLDPKVQLSVLHKMKKRPKLVILDTMNFWMNSTWDSLMKVIAETDVITINDEEARQLSREYSLIKAAKKIHAMGPKYVIIKKGEHGAILFYKDEIFALPALPLEEVFDPTGAGDAFAGGFAAYLTKTEDLSFENMKKAIVVGSAMASRTVEKFGTKSIENYTNEELKERIKQFQGLTAFESLTV